MHIFLRGFDVFIKAGLCWCFLSLVQAFYYLFGQISHQIRSTVCSHHDLNSSFFSLFFSLCPTFVPILNGPKFASSVGLHAKV